MINFQRFLIFVSVGNSSIKKLVDFLKSEQAQTGFRLLDEKLTKAGQNTITSTAVDSPSKVLEGQKQMEQLAEENWGSGHPPASSDMSEDAHRHQSYIEQEPQAHHLERRLPHPNHKEKPWDVYELGMGEQSGRPMNQGMPMSSHELLQAIEGGNMDTHRAVIRPSSKTEGWTRLKGHPNFRNAVQNHLGSLYDKIVRGSGSVANEDSYHAKNLRDMNQQELAMINGRR